MRRAALLALAALLLPSRARGHALERLDVDLGGDLGLDAESEVDPVTLRRVMESAEEGAAESLYLMGLFRLHGVSLARDWGKARDYFRRAAQSGHGKGGLALGSLLYHGLGGQRDLGAARLWLERAAASLDRGDADLMLGTVLYELAGHTARGASEKAALYAAAGASFRGAAAKGEPRALHYLGVMAEYGRGGGGAPRFREALDRYGDACNRGVDVACFHLSLMHAYGRGCSVDRQQAALLMARAAQGTFVPAVYYLGIFSRQGLGMPVDYGMALLHFERAASLAITGDEIGEKARRAGEELRRALDDARESNREALERFDISEAEADAVVSAQGPWAPSPSRQEPLET